MKYIRIEDGIYEITATPETNKLYENSNMIQIYDRKIFVRRDININTIISQADTIEELCDCFYGEFENGAKIILEKWNGNKFVIWWATNMVSMIKDLNKTYKNVKGAIWTDKGLIYVTKMNDKGGWELL